jgi:hypothetical protein
MWKASNDPQYPIKMKTRERQENAITTRNLTEETLQKLEDQQKQKRVLRVMLLKCGTMHLRKLDNQKH